MRELKVTPAHGNQVTISAEIGSTVTSFTLESAYGSVKSSREPEDFEALIRIAKDEKAEATARELRQQVAP